MSAVTKQEIVEALLEAKSWVMEEDDFATMVNDIVSRIEQHGIAPEPKGEEAIAPPDGWVLVPAEPTQEMIDAGIMFGTSPTKVSIIWSNMLAAAPEVSE